MDTTMCRIDEQDFPIEPRQLTREKWQNFKRRVTERAQQDRQQVLCAPANCSPGQSPEANPPMLRITTSRHVHVAAAA
jgi:hypothetical protein